MAETPAPIDRLKSPLVNTAGRLPSECATYSYSVPAPLNRFANSLIVQPIPENPTATSTMTNDPTPPDNTPTTDPSAATEKIGPTPARDWETQSIVVSWPLARRPAGFPIQRVAGKPSMTQRS